MTYGIFLVVQILVSKTAEGVTPPIGFVFPDFSLMSPSNRFKAGSWLLKSTFFVSRNNRFSVYVYEMFSKNNQRFHIHYRIW